MLDRDQVQFIADHFDSVDLDYYVLAGIWGEPFLCDGVMCYFDGETLQVVGSPLGSALKHGATRIREVIERWVLDERVWFVNYYGPHDLCCPGKDWNLVYSCEPRPWNVELFARLPHHVRRNDIRRLERRGYETWVGRRDLLT